MERYRQIIHIEGKCIEDIFYLDCVLSVMKTDRGIAYNVKCRDSKVLAFVGECLCEDFDGYWHVCTSNEYDKLMNYDSKTGNNA